MTITGILGPDAAADSSALIIVLTLLAVLLLTGLLLIGVALIAGVRQHGRHHGWHRGWHRGRRHREGAAPPPPSGEVARIRPRGHHTVLVLTRSLTPATLRSISHGRRLHPDELRLVHIVLDPEQVATLVHSWDRHPGLTAELELVDCPHRRLNRAVVEVTRRAVGEAKAHVTVLLPHETQPALLHTLRHDRRIDQLARVIARIPGADAVVVPPGTRSLGCRHASVGPASDLAARPG